MACRIVNSAAFSFVSRVNRGLYICDCELYGFSLMYVVYIKKVFSAVERVFEVVILVLFVWLKVENEVR